MYLFRSVVATGGVARGHSSLLDAEKSRSNIVSGGRGIACVPSSKSVPGPNRAQRCLSPGSQLAAPNINHSMKFNNIGAFELARRLVASQGQTQRATSRVK